jgi:hypothetical protein
MRLDASMIGGLLSSDEIIKSTNIELDGRFRDDFLTRRLYIDCAKMRVNADLFAVLRKIKSQIMVVLAYRQHGMLCADV